MNTNTISEQEFNDIYKEYRPRLFAFAKKFVLDHSQIEDVLHDVFLTLLKQDADKVKENLGGWLFTVTKNSSLKALKRFNTKLLRDSISYHDRSEIEDEIVDESIRDPFVCLSNKDMAKVLLNKLKKLSQRDRKVVRLRYFENLTYDEIAAKTKLNNGYIGWILNNSIKVLRSSILEHESPKAKLPKINLKKALANK